MAVFARSPCRHAAQSSVAGPCPRFATVFRLTVPGRPNMSRRNPCLQEGRLRSTADDAGYASDSMQPHELNQALEEALQIFNQSQLMANLQVQHELEQSFAADQPASSSPEAAAAAHPDALEAFWCEQGLARPAAAALLAELSASGRYYSLNQVSSKVQRLRRILPDADIASMAVKDVGVLDVDTNVALMNMICLVEAFPGRDIVMLLARQPRLLWCDDLRERVPRVFRKLMELHPSKDLAVVREIIADNPELLYRMDYYMDAMLIDYLPIEIQNMMVLTGQGIGFLYRYYNNARTNYQAEIARHEFPLD